MLSFLRLWWCLTLLQLAVTLGAGSRSLRTGRSQDVISSNANTVGGLPGFTNWEVLGPFRLGTRGEEAFLIHEIID